MTMRELLKSKIEACENFAKLSTLPEAEKVIEDEIKVLKKLLSDIDTYRITKIQKRG